MGVRFIRVVEFIRGRWVHSGSPRVSLCSSWVVGFTQVRPWFIQGGVVWFIMYHWAPYGSLRLLEVGGLTRMRPGGCWVQPGSLVNALLGVGFMRGRWVHPRTLGSLGCALGEFRFKRGR